MTEQNILSPTRDECATFVQRYCASIIDGAAVLLLVDIAGIFSLCVISDFSHIAIATGCQLLIFALYFSLFESSSLCATPGKLALKLQVVRADGGKVNLLEAFWRVIVGCLPLAVVPGLAFWYARVSSGFGATAQAVVFTVICLGLIYSVGYVMMLFTPKRQSLFDQLTKRVVVKKRIREIEIPILGSQSAPVLSVDFLHSLTEVDSG
jgi:uncharacterized RDD family membrane protein YckC